MPCDPGFDVRALVQRSLHEEQALRAKAPSGCGLHHWSSSWLTPSGKYATTLAIGWRNCSSSNGSAWPIATIAMSSAFLDEGLLRDRLLWKHPMGASLCDGISAVQAPPADTLSHHRPLFCNDVPAMQLQYSLRAMQWMRQLGPNSDASHAAARRALHETPCYACYSADPSGCCGEHGTCILGLCACHDGWSGLDCAHPRPASAPPASTPYASPTPGSSSSEPRRSLSADALPVGLAIYVYDMPATLGLMHRPSGYKAARRRHLYMAEELFVSRLLEDTVGRAAVRNAGTGASTGAGLGPGASASTRLRAPTLTVTRVLTPTQVGRGAVRTADPEAADLFFVPTLQWFTQGNRCPRAAVRLTAHYVRSAFPYWERSGGRDHVFMMPADSGGCWFDGELGDLLILTTRCPSLPDALFARMHPTSVRAPSVGAHPIFITHWGLLGNHNSMRTTHGRQHDFDSQ